MTISSKARPSPRIARSIRADSSGEENSVRLDDASGFKVPDSFEVAGRGEEAQGKLRCARVNCDLAIADRQHPEKPRSVANAIATIARWWIFPIG
jgi:hypothetical protein